MWRYKGSKDDAGTLYDAAKMKQYIHGKGTATKTKEKPEKLAADMVESSKVALLKLKTLLGARKYMRTKKISDIFKIQMEEIGNMLDAIETELTNNPRQGRKTYAPWIRQDLQRHWIDYMNERFAIAKRRTHNDMDTYLKLYHETWCDGRPKSEPESPAGSRSGSLKGGSRAGSSKAGSSKAGSSKAGSSKSGLQSRSSRPSSRQGSRPGSRAGSPGPTEDLTALLGAMDLDDIFDALDHKDVAIVDICRFHGKLQKEWNKEKLIPWEAPW